MKVIKFIVPDNLPWHLLQEAAYALGSRSYTDIDGILTFLPQAPVIKQINEEGNYAQADIRGAGQH